MILALTSRDTRFLATSEVLEDQAILSTFALREKDAQIRAN
jgi:hypothetical protein